MRSYPVKENPKDKQTSSTLYYRLGYKHFISVKKDKNRYLEWGVNILFFGGGGGSLIFTRGDLFQEGGGILPQNSYKPSRDL